MKTTFRMIVFLFVSLPLYAQGRPDSTAARPRRAVSTGSGEVATATTGVAPTGSAPAGHTISGPAAPEAAATNPRFMDEDGDGIDDRAVGKGQGIRRGKDRFIDEDGDGICDTRAGGLGLRQRGSGAGAMTGTDGKGKMRRLGSGGKP